MNIAHLQDNIYYDPQTRLPNFFHFIESDFKVLFGDDGFIHIVDLQELKLYEELNGNANTELCIRYLAEALENIRKIKPEASVYRTNGNEFTIIIPRGKPVEWKQYERGIKSEFQDFVKRNGLTELVAKQRTICYNSGIASVDAYYELLMRDTIESSRSGCISEKDGEELLAGIVGNVLSRVKDTLTYYNRANDLCLMDDVSGIQNHRACNQYLSNLMNEFKEKHGIGVLFIDGDNLKRYNEISYKEGNQLIRRLSEIISQTIRNGDRVYRWLSGDEFIVVLKEANEEKALSTAERIRNAVELGLSDMVYPVTVSIGVSCYPKDGETMDEIIQRAERANMMAKRMGKNRVMLWEDECEKKNSPVNGLSDY